MNQEWLDIESWARGWFDGRRWFMQLMPESLSFRMEGFDRLDLDDGWLISLRRMAPDEACSEFDRRVAIYNRLVLSLTDTMRVAQEALHRKSCLETVRFINAKMMEMDRNAKTSGMLTTLEIGRHVFGIERSIAVETSGAGQIA